jgi:hypothetical protein
MRNKLLFVNWGWQGLGIFLFTTVSRPVLGLTQPPIQWVPGALSLAVKRPGCEADHSPPSSAEVKECVELYLHSPNTFMAWCSIEAQGLLYFYLFPRDTLHCSVSYVHTYVRTRTYTHTQIRARAAKVYPKVSGLAAWSENCKQYKSLPLHAVVSLFCESV